ncbi:MAG: hypothetical protein JNJ61_20790 [Anaerolineae bacterium]|nr:hypothetical protein [Anaerolineae bacterium]
MKPRSMTLFLLILLSSILIILPTYAQEQPAASSLLADQISDYADFLSDHYAITLPEVVEQSQFTDSVLLIAPAAEIPSEIDLEGFNNLEAVLLALYYTNLDELAFTYPESKIEAGLSTLSAVPEGLPLPRQQELTAAIDAGLVDATFAAAYDLNAPVSAESAYYLLGQILDQTGQYKHDIGFVSDPDIYNHLIYTWESFDQVLSPDLQSPANQLIRDGIITGYNLKRTSLNADFDPQRTIIYGHANIDHARQLIALLRSEGLDARVQLEPKTSAFLYLAEWGEPTASPEFQVEALDDGNYIAYAKEYDLVFEFSDTATRDLFDTIIKTYAKKDADDEPGLILGSWWQPLYSSTVAIPDYIAVKNNVVYVGDFYLQSFSLTENSEAIIDSFTSDYPSGTVEVWDLWVNEAFHNYLLGLPT